MRPLHSTALALTSASVVGFSVTWWNRIPPLGDDASSHIVAMSRVAEILKTGAGWWAPDFNLGFPIGLYYQPLPHFVGGVLTWLLGGGAAAILAYKLIAVALVALSPWCVARGAGRLGLSPIAATAAGIASVMVTSSLEFGLTIHSSLVLALHSQAWAALWLPLALGEVARVIDGDRRSAPWAIVTWSLLFLSHFFYGVALLAVAAVWILCRPRDLLRRLGRGVAIGLLTGLTLSFWLVPLLTTLPSMGGWPFGSATRVDGYGWAEFLGPLVRGDLLDGEDGLPILTTLAASGLLLCLVRAFRQVPARLVLTCAVLTGLFTVGRAGLGSLVDLFYLNRSVQMFRYLGLFHLSAMWLVGWTVGEAVEAVRHRRMWLQAALALLLVLVAVAPASRAADDLRLSFRTIADVGTDVPQYFGLVDAIRQETRENGSGRIFVHPRSGLHGHFHSGLLALWSASSTGQSYGVGLHDSLNFYYLEFFHPERDRSSTFVDLYGFQYIAADAETDFSAVAAEEVYASSNYTLWRVDHRQAMCRPIEVDSRPVSYPRMARGQVLAWLNGNGPGEGVHPLLTVPSGLAFGGVTEAPVRMDGRTLVQSPAGPAGWLLASQSGADRVDCRVVMNRPGAVLFRVSYHPFWRILVDGRQATLSYAFPAFAAVELGKGEHEVMLTYQLPGYQLWLILIAPLPSLATWALSGGFPRRSRRRMG